MFNIGTEEAKEEQNISTSLKASVLRVPQLTSWEELRLVLPTLCVFEISMKGVKELVSEGITEIPERYITPEDARANDSQMMAEGIPLIDFSSEDRDLLVKEVAQAASKWGFFQVINHGVPNAVMESMTKAALAFFDLPPEEKAALFSEDYKLPVRFCTSFVPSVETHWDWQDSLNHRFPPYGEDHPWPEKPDLYKTAAMEYVDAVTAFGNLILAALSEGLGLQADYFAKVFGPNRVSVRLNYYPPCPRPDLAVGLRPHSDFGGFTILLQDQVGGLQVKNNGVWYSVKPIPNSFVVNVADQLQIASNGKYQSAEHRAAVNSTQARLSIAAFFGPGDDVVVAPVKELISEDNPARYRESRYGDYRGKRLSTNLDSKRGIEQLQI